MSYKDYIEPHSIVKIRRPNKAQIVFYIKTINKTIVNIYYYLLYLGVLRELIFCASVLGNVITSHISYETYTTKNNYWISQYYHTLFSCLRFNSGK